MNTLKNGREGRLRCYGPRRSSAQGSSVSNWQYPCGLQCSVPSSPWRAAPESLVQLSEHEPPLAPHEAHVALAVGARGARGAERAGIRRLWPESRASPPPEWFMLPAPPSLAASGGMVLWPLGCTAVEGSPVSQLQPVSATDGRNHYATCQHRLHVDLPSQGYLVVFTELVQAASALLRAAGPRAVRARLAGVSAGWLPRLRK